MAYIENIVIGTPIVDPKDMFASDEDDWARLEEEKTYYTEERFLPRILVDIGIYPSVSEIRRNKPELMISLDKLDFIDNLKASKKRKLWILVGEWLPLKANSIWRWKMDNKIERLLKYIDESNNIVFFGGAGVSTESGIPDFRSKDGLYNQHDVKFDN